MKVIYIAGPYRGANAWAVEQNIRRAEELSFAVNQMGATAICPHTITRFFNGTLTDDHWLVATMEIMRRCDAVLLTDNWKTSTGARAEHDEAMRVTIPVFYSIASLGRWLMSMRGRA
jgi:hypothetical protein